MSDRQKTVPGALVRITEQPRVRKFLAAAVTSRRLSHAYLFVGPPGSGKNEAALALAQCVICPNGGDGSCDECIRVAHGTHPDVEVLSPESATGYLVSQVRGLIDDASLAPVRASTKVYILRDAGLLRGAAANALLKTIEEPPPSVMFILIARSVATVLPTIASRCQQVPFRVIATDAAVRLVELRCGANPDRARVALSVAGTPERAVGFIASPERRQLRRLMVRTIGELARDDDWDVLVAVRELLTAIKAPLATIKEAQDTAAKVNSDYLGAWAQRQLADANKRELTVRERLGMMEALAAASSLLRDVLLCREGVSQHIVNVDVADMVGRLAHDVGTDGILAALAAVEVASDDLVHNVSPQLILEVMLLHIKEALTCRLSYR